MSHFRTLVYKDSGPETYNKWASSYEADVSTTNYAGYRSVNSKWRSYYTELSSDSTAVKHKIFDAGCGIGLLGEDLVTLVPRDQVEIYGGDLSPG